MNIDDVKSFDGMQSNNSGTEIIIEYGGRYLIIKSPEGLKEPLLCFAAMQSYCKETGSNFLEKMATAIPLTWRSRGCSYAADS